MTDPCDLYIVRDGDVVRIEAKDGPKMLAVIEMTVLDFATVLMGDGPVMGAIERKP